MIRIRFQTFFVLIVIALLVFACGGGGGDDGATSATSSTVTSTTTTSGGGSANTPPVIASVGTPSGVQSGLVQFIFAIKDAESDSCNLVVEYTKDGGGNWFAATPGTGSVALLGLATTDSGVVYTFVWDSTADSVGISAEEFGVQIRIRAYDGTDYGEFARSGVFTVDNHTNQGPEVTVESPSGRYEGDVTINYTLSDVNADSASLTVEYTNDGGTTWFTATSAGGDSGITGLSTDASGKSYKFIWSSDSDGVGNAYPPENIKIKITPSDSGSTGTAVETTSFEVINLAHGIFVSVGALNKARYSFRGTLLADGNILVCGGALTDGSATDTAELIDTTDFSVSLVGPMNKVRSNGAGVVLLDSGKVLVAGGRSVTAEATAELYDPVAKTFALSPNFMTRPRQWAAHAKMSDGKVLIAGGYNDGEVDLEFAEIYDPDMDTFSAVTDMNEERYFPTGVLLPDGKVMISGGRRLGNTFSNTAEVYDPVGDSWTMVNNNLQVTGYGKKSILLKNGTVLVCGGWYSDSYRAEADIYDPATNNFTTTGNMTSARYGHELVMMSSGKVMAIGGHSSATVGTDTAGVYDSASGTFTAINRMGIGRAFFQAYWLTSQGVALVVGGRYNNASACSPNIQIYYP